jgi:pimeloyl-ACP methyl ester carboxylesterase
MTGLDPKREYLRRLLGNTPVSFEEAASSQFAEKTNAVLIESASNAVESVKADRGLSDSDLSILEAIVVPFLRPVFDITNDSFPDPPAPWNSLSEAKHRKNIETALLAIGRVEVAGLPGVPYGGTGFIVGPNLVLTNRHVAELFSSGVGLSDLVFRPGRTAGMDLKQEPASNQSILLKVQRVRMVHPWWDAAFLEVDGIPPGRPVLALCASEPEKLNERLVATVGYPAFDSRSNVAMQIQMFHGLFQKKRLLPGNLMGYRSIESFGHVVEALAHDCSTLGGNSGSALVDPETGLIVGLHFAGLYLQANFAVPSWQLALDPKVVNLGIQFSAPATTSAGKPVWLQAWDEIVPTERALGAQAVPLNRNGSRKKRLTFSGEWLDRARVEDVALSLREDRQATLEMLSKALGEAEAQQLATQLTGNHEGVLDLFDPLPDPDPDLPEIIYLHGIMGGHLARPGFLRDRLWLDPLDVVFGNLGRTLMLASDGMSAGDGKIPLEPDGLLQSFYGDAARTWRRKRFVVHPFSYDWRLSIETLADTLHNFIQSKKQSHSSKRFVIVAHSMGGLISSSYALRHPEWQDTIQRAIFMGSPLGGSYAPLQAVTGTYDLLRKLCFVSTRNSLDDLRKMARTLPGLMDMLPNPRLFPDAKEAYSSTRWPDGIVPLQRWLDQSQNLKPAILSSPLLDRTTLLVSLSHGTVSSAHVEKGFLAASQATGAGDGTVPGRAAVIDGVPAFKVNFDHSHIPKDPLAIQAVIDLITTGSTTLQPVQPTDLNVTFPAREASVIAEGFAEGIQERFKNGELSSDDLDWLFRPGF